MVDGEVTCVNQMFGGPICGNAVLLFDKSAALILTELLTNVRCQSLLDQTAQDVIVEVGNILLNACLGSFGNMMSMNIKFTVPQLQLPRAGGDALERLGFERLPLHQLWMHRAL